jgi:hypothetical protein
MKTITMTHGGTLHLNGGAPVDVSLGGVFNAPPVTVDVRGVQPLTFSDIGYYDGITVNLAAHSEWIGTFGSTEVGANIHVNGPGVWDNNGASSVTGTAIIGANVVGNGGISQFNSHTNGKLEFLHSVGPGQSIHIAGYAQYGGEHGVLQIDDPSAFHAEETDLGFGEIILKGMHATSYAWQHDMLSMYQGNRVVDTMHVYTDRTWNAAFGASQFGVSQVGNNVVIHADTNGYYAGGGAGGVALGVHG